MIDLLKGGAVGKRPSRQKSGREMVWAVLEVDGVQRAGMGSGISIKAEADNEWRMARDLVLLLEVDGVRRTGMGTSSSSSSSGISVKAEADDDR